MINQKDDTYKLALKLFNKSNSTISKVHENILDGILVDSLT